MPLPSAIRVVGGAAWVFISVFPFFSMETPTKEPAAEAAKTPIKVLRIDDVSASIFARETKTKNGKVTYYSVSFSRSYKDPSGQWKYTKSFSLDDLGNIVELCKQANDFVRDIQK